MAKLTILGDDLYFIAGLKYLIKDFFDEANIECDHMTVLVISSSSIMNVSHQLMKYKDINADVIFCEKCRFEFFTCLPHYYKTTIITLQQNISCVKLGILTAISLLGRNVPPSELIEQHQNQCRYICYFLANFNPSARRSSRDYNSKKSSYYRRRMMKELNVHSNCELFFKLKVMMNIRLN